MAMIRRSYEDRLRTPETKEMIAIICAAVELFSRICIIIDGLDECKKNVWQDVLILIKDLIQKRTPCVKVFVSCREEDQILQGFSRYSHIQISTEVFSRDIIAFIQGTVRSRLDSGDLKIINPALEKDISNKLEAKAQGMFLWVSFQLDDICEASSDALIRKILEDLPYGLVETYQRILTKIHKSPSLIGGPSQIASVLGIGSKVYAIAYRLWGGSPEAQTSQIDYAKFLTRKSGKVPDPDLTQRYRLLNYVIENWLRHTMVDGYSALQLAAENGHQSAVQLLLDSGACRSWEGRVSPIHLAVDNSQAAMIYTLLQNGIDPMTRDRKGMCEIIGDLNELRRMIYKHRFDLWTPLFVPLVSDSMTALHIAVELGDESAVQALLTGSTLELINAECSIGGMTALHLAIRDGQIQILKTLLRAGADLDMTCATGMNALHLAIQYEREMVVKMLLGEGAHPDSRNSLGSTALHMTAKIGSHITRALLKSGADLEAQENDTGYSALHIATIYRDPLVVKILLDHGASTRAKVGQTELGPNIWINTILSFSSSFLAQDIGFTALGLAARNGADMVVDALLDGGADINFRSGRQRLTALEYAVNNGYDEVVQILLRRADSTSSQYKPPATEQWFREVQEEEEEEDDEEDIMITTSKPQHGFELTERASRKSE
ncbi:hypothetical protein MMC29_003482 [Sticta canariensis]|nr:hypothetical protein [Sticta canariensis]